MLCDLSVTVHWASREVGDLQGIRFQVSYRLYTIISEITRWVMFQLATRIASILCILGEVLGTGHFIRGGGGSELFLRPPPPPETG